MLRIIIPSISLVFVINCADMAEVPENGSKDANAPVDVRSPAKIDAVLPPDGTNDPLARAGRIRCGNNTCNSETELCVVCDHGDSRDVHCLERQGNDIYEQARLASEAHECNQFQSLFIACDDSNDCPEDSVCRFVSGETGYADCTEAGPDHYGNACSTTNDCSPGAPLCDEYDPFGYFSPHKDLLGWVPTACHDSAVQ